MTYGFIGTGNMGGTIASVVAANAEDAVLLLANRTPEKAQRLADKTGARVVSNIEAAQADRLFLGIKPQQLFGVMDEIGPYLKKGTVIVSMAAGTPIAKIKEKAPGCAVIRIMPNTAVAVNEGIILYSTEDGNPDAVLESDLAGCGKLFCIPEKMIDAAGTVSACGPAFADMFVEALSDGGVLCGIPRKTATELAAQMVVGAGKLILETGKHPSVLKDEVCSPGGTTIEGVRALEEKGFNSAVISAVSASYEKNSRLN